MATTEQVKTEPAKIVHRHTEEHAGRVWYRWDCESCGTGMRYLNLEAMKRMSQYHLNRFHRKDQQ